MRGKDFQECWRYVTHQNHFLSWFSKLQVWIKKDTILPFDLVLWPKGSSLSIYKIKTKFQFQTHLNTFMLLQYKSKKWPKLDFLLIKVVSNENFIYKSIYKIITKFQFQACLNTFILLQYSSQKWPKLNFLTNKSGLKWKFYLQINI